MARDDGPQIKAELNKAMDHLDRATQSIDFLLGELATIRDLAYRGVGSPMDALKAIQARASRAIEAES